MHKHKTTQKHSHRHVHHSENCVHKKTNTNTLRHIYALTRTSIHTHKQIYRQHINNTPATTTRSNKHQHTKRRMNIIKRRKTQPHQQTHTHPQLHANRLTLEHIRIQITQTRTNTITNRTYNNKQNIQMHGHTHIKHTHAHLHAHTNANTPKHRHNYTHKRQDRK